MLPVVVDTFAEAVSDVPDGATVMIGGFGGSGGQPTRLMLALADQGPREITIIGKRCGDIEDDWLRLASSSRADRPRHLLRARISEQDHLLVSDTGPDATALRD